MVIASRQSELENICIGIGFRRCGSSWLHRLLSAQSSVHKPKDGLHFFSEQYERGIEWYETEIMRPSNNTNNIVEMSVSYSYPEYAHVVAQRIFDMFGQTPIFAVVRNPVDRAYSDFLRSLRTKEIAETSFVRAMGMYPEFVERGRYAQLLQPFVNIFGSDAVHVLIYEELLADPERELGRLLAALNIPFNSDEFLIYDRKLDWGRPRSQGAYSLIYGVKNFSDSLAEKLNLYTYWSALKARYIKRYQRLIASLSEKEEIDPGAKQYLTDNYRDDVKALEVMLGRTLPWGGFDNER